MKLGLIMFKTTISETDFILQLHFDRLFPRKMTVRRKHDRPFNQDLFAISVYPNKTSETGMYHFHQDKRILFAVKTIAFERAKHLL